MAMKRCLLYDTVNTSELLAKNVVCLLIEKKKNPLISPNLHLDLNHIPLPEKAAKVWSHYCEVIVMTS